jgi:hypothetical protein
MVNLAAGLTKGWIAGKGVKNWGMGRRKRRPGDQSQHRHRHQLHRLSHFQRSHDLFGLVPLSS